MLQVNYITYPPTSDEVVEESAFCGMLDENVPKYFPIYEFSFVIFFFLPLIVLVALYTKIGLQIRASALGNSVDGSVHGETRQSQSRKSIIRMLCEFNTNLPYIFIENSYHIQNTKNRPIDFYMSDFF